MHASPRMPWVSLMAFKRVSCVYAACDYCSDTADEFHWTTEKDAKYIAEESGYRFWEGAQWCWDCNPLCICGHGFGNHDFGEDGCADDECPKFRLDINWSNE